MASRLRFGVFAVPSAALSAGFVLGGVGRAHVALAEPSASAAKQMSHGTSARPQPKPIKVDQEALRSRRIFLTGKVSESMAKSFTEQMLYMQACDQDTPVTVFINSHGGSVHAGLAIIDVMSCASMPVATVGYGSCCSMAALILAAGTLGMRSVHANARVMIHEPSASYNKHVVTDMMIRISELALLQGVLEQVLANRCGRSVSEVAFHMARDKYMSAAEAADFGIVDCVLDYLP